MTIIRVPRGYAVVETKTGLIWRTLPTYSLAEAWMEAAE